MSPQPAKRSLIAECFNLSSPRPSGRKSYLEKKTRRNSFESIERRSLIFESLDSTLHLIPDDDEGDKKPETSKTRKTSKRRRSKPKRSLLSESRSKSLSHIEDDAFSASTSTTESMLSVNSSFASLDISAHSLVSTEAPIRNCSIESTDTMSTLGSTSSRRESIHVPITTPLNELHMEKDEHEEAMPRRSSSVTFCDFAEMTFIDAEVTVSTHELLYYSEDELAEMRHEAFLESCGLDKDNWE